ncbi:putative hydrolase [Nocardia asteroides NBRC 15531]|uniref:Hydrolase n=1 Tax=Nocardia asteroides NBRC 15531 TaxID=1110697 RepID=U5E3Z5_NOCAS|nr:putative hydrolase [Nocardia asteroides NBRC 15531]
MARPGAVLMIDMQNAYLREDVRSALGWPPIWRLNETITACSELLAAARDAGWSVIYSRQMLSQAMNPRAERHRRSRRAVPVLSVQEQQWRSEIIDAVAPQPGDVVLDKTRPNFFAYTELALVLKNLGVERVLVAGLQTNICVEATVRAALEHNFEVAVAADAVSTDGPALHYASLNSMRVMYVEVDSWRELMAPDAAWDKAFTTPNYGRDTGYWSEPVRRTAVAEFTRGTR